MLEIGASDHVNLGNVMIGVYLRCFLISGPSLFRFIGVYLCDVNAVLANFRIIPFRMISCFCTLMRPSVGYGVE